MTTPMTEHFKALFETMNITSPSTTFVSVPELGVMVKIEVSELPD